MGTIIDLRLGDICLDWSKNSMGIDHGMLFQDRDRHRIPCEQVDYSEANPEDDEIQRMELAFSRTLREIVPRLDLLGFGLERAAKDYADFVENHCINDLLFPNSPPQNTMDFSEFLSFVTRHPLSSLSREKHIVGDTNYVPANFGSLLELQRIPRFAFYNTSSSELDNFVEIIGILHPYSLMRILAENEANLNTDVVWHYGALAENGWAAHEDFKPNARRLQTFLIATEGSSDTSVISHAIALLRPDIADFFRFVDMKDDYPFSGSGNLVNLAKGLSQIDMHNMIVYLFDNDGEGYSAFQKVQRLDLPKNMRPLMLPELEEFRNFPTLGPEGPGFADINRRAAAIECYLDLRLENRPPPRVIWSSYKSDIQMYHGALDHKESYLKPFLKLNTEDFGGSNYDVSKLEQILELLISECASIAHDISQD